ncbi:MAG: hypothetical protein GXO65_01945 [Euryarchaeota archaeon]|nr:hypothetical protein [Euryarchaeota archaeon]
MDTETKKFANTAVKINVIKSVFGEGEKLKGKEIVERVRAQGYKVKDANLKMFIYYNMLYKHLKKEDINGINHYSLV